MNAHPGSPRFDRAFIEEHQLLDKYLTDVLPLKGARDLENWCRDNPQYLEELNLARRTAAGLKLLEAVGKPQDLSEPGIAWWRSVYFQIGLAVIACGCGLGLWLLWGKLTLMRNALDEARAIALHGTLVPPTSLASLRVSPDPLPGIDKARVSVNHAYPSLLDLKIDMSHTKIAQFKLTLEKSGQGRAMVIDNLMKDSNGDLEIAFNSSGLAAGEYRVRIDGLPFRANPIGQGWLLLSVQ